MTYSKVNWKRVLNFLVCGSSRYLGFIFFFNLFLVRRCSLTLFLFFLRPEALEEIENGQDDWQLIINFLHRALVLDTPLVFRLRVS